MMHSPLTAAVLCLAAAGPALAQTATSQTLLAEDDARSSRNPIIETGSEADHLLGDFGGARSRLVARGLHLGLGYVAEELSVFRGGNRRGTAFAGMAIAIVDCDLGKLAGWQRGYFRVSALWLHGDSVSRKFAGDELAVSNIDGYDSIRLYELWFEQGFFNDRLWVRAGSLLADSEFAFTETGGLFLNGAFGWPAFISGNTVNTGPAFHVPALGARVWFEPNARWYFQGGVYDGDTFDNAAGDPRPTANGTHFHLDGAQGVFALYEFGYRAHHTTNATGLRGTYKLGAWHHSRGQTGYGSTPVPNHTFGFYALADQQLWRENGVGTDAQGLNAFARFGATPQERAKFAWVLDAGLTYTGPIPGRDDDVFGAGFVYAKHSHFLPTTHESVIEVSYKVQLKPWWSLQPDLQWVCRPAGDKTIPDAWVAGVRTTLTF